MTTNKDTAAYCAASLIAPLGLKTLLETLKAWEQAYEAILEKMGPEEKVTIGTEVMKPASAVIGQTQGGRKMPIINQAEIQQRIDGVKGRVIALTRAREVGIPEDAIEWAEKRGITHIYDNRASQAENPKRPAFKAVNAEGEDVKMEDGKSLSYWGAK